MNIPSGAAAATAKPKRTSRASAVEGGEAAVRERILAAALAAFAERGFHGTSVPEIAAGARVGVGSIYRHFDSKERLVNAVFRGAKARLRDTLLLGFELTRAPDAMFADLWWRLVRFQRAEPLTFQFLEMQDHVPYLDGESRAVEASLLAPIVSAASAVSGPRDGALLIAIVWGAFVSLTKAQRLGYLTLDDASLRRAGEICFASFAFALAQPASVVSKKKKKPHGE